VYNALAVRDKEKKRTPVVASHRLTPRGLGKKGGNRSGWNLFFSASEADVSRKKKGGGVSMLAFVYEGEEKEREFPWTGRDLRLNHIRRKKKVPSTMDDYSPLKIEWGKKIRQAPRGPVRSNLCKEKKKRGNATSSPSKPLFISEEEEKKRCAKTKTKKPGRCGKAALRLKKEQLDLMPLSRGKKKKTLGRVHHHLRREGDNQPQRGEEGEKKRRAARCAALEEFRGKKEEGG